jgi:transcriptional regulator with XRE-family HTH domain
VIAAMIGKRIDTLVRESGLSQSETSYDLRVPAPVLSRWRHGVHTPSAEHLVNLCRHYGVSADWLLGLTDERGASVGLPVRARTAEEIVLMADELLDHPPQPRRSTSRKRS